MDFNPRSPCGERLLIQYVVRVIVLFQSTLPVWGATIVGYQNLDELKISIHAPRVGSDRMDGSSHSSMSYFNPRSPCGERLQYLADSGLGSIFQSTLPVWGATPRPGSWPVLPEFQSTLPVWGATFATDVNNGVTFISIHAPRVGSDRMTGAAPRRRPRFQSTLPVWGATPRQTLRGLKCERFQSTLPVWGATRRRRLQHQPHIISIHAPRVGSDWRLRRRWWITSIFQSTLPVWGATRPRKKYKPTI